MKTRTIALSRGFVALVDASDYARLMASGPWHATKPTSSGNVYARHSVHIGDGKTIAIRMHHLITGSTYVDHVNGDGLDNRRVNLRPADHGTNMANKRLYRNNKSGFKGVRQHQNGRWVATCGPDYLGCYATPEEAARVYDAAAVARWGEFARPNFESARVAA